VKKSIDTWCVSGDSTPWVPRFYAAARRDFAPPFRIITAIAALMKLHQQHIDLFTVKSFRKNAFPNAFTPI
jgi:hypothetical protein